MPRSVVIAITVLGVLALFASTTFALVRSTQLRSSRARVAALASELAAARDDAAPPSEAAPSNPLDDLLDGEGGDSLDELLPDGGEGLDDLLGGDVAQLAQCVQPAGAPGSRDVPEAGPTEQIAQISELVTELRSLEFTDAPDPEFLDDEQLSQRLAAEVTEEYDAEDAEIDARLLAALGAVPADIDLIELQTELLASQVAGFYDPDTGELVVRGAVGDDGLSPTGQSTLAHELQHALADQTLDLPIDTTEDTSQSDAALAALSLVEGDATLTQQQFTITGLNLSEQLALSADPDALSAQEQLADVPHYLAQSLQFPYLAGLRFVCERYLAGGWDAVNAAYDDLPTTSAEILDPQRYGTDAIDPRDPGDPGGDWERQRTTTLGAADLLWLFEAPGNDTARALDEPRDRALAWTGGEVTVWTDGDATALGIALTQDAAGSLCDSIATWYERAFPDSTDAPTRRDERLVREGSQHGGVVTCAGDEVRVGIAPDATTARAVAR
ncbi:MAG: hypothetical protein KY460_05215 [Actinobacteria bacterium]|nr:hypothetical protein [Actinomycetota bacterium]